MSSHAVARGCVFLSSVSFVFVVKDPRISRGDLCDNFTFGMCIALCSAKVNLINGGVDIPSHFSSVFLHVSARCSLFLTVYGHS